VGVDTVPPPTYPPPTALADPAQADVLCGVCGADFSHPAIGPHADRRRLLRMHQEDQHNGATDLYEIAAMREVDELVPTWPPLAPQWGVWSREPRNQRARDANEAAAWLMDAAPFPALVRPLDLAALVPPDAPAAEVYPHGRRDVPAWSQIERRPPPPPPMRRPVPPGGRTRLG